MRKRSDEIHRDGATQRKPYNAERLGAPVDGRGGSREEELQSEEAGGVAGVGGGGVAAAPEVCLRKNQLSLSFFLSFFSEEDG